MLVSIIRIYTSNCYFKLSFYDLNKLMKFFQTYYHVQFSEYPVKKLIEEYFEYLVIFYHFTHKICDYFFHSLNGINKWSNEQNIVKWTNKTLNKFHKSNYLEGINWEFHIFCLFLLSIFHTSLIFFNFKLSESFVSIHHGNFNLICKMVTQPI